MHGLILMNAFHTTDNVNNSDVPQFAVPVTCRRPRGSTSSATVRQSRVTVFALVPDFAGGAIKGELDVDFFGGQQPSTGGRTFPLLRIRRAMAELTWNRVALLVGQESPPIAAVSPSSHRQHRLPRVRRRRQSLALDPADPAERRLSPSAGGLPHRRRDRGARAHLGRGPGHLPHPARHRRAERTAVPPGKSARTLGHGDRAGELSAGGHYGWIVDAAGERVPSKALAVSIWTPLGARARASRAEGFTGQALAGLGGGGIGQNMVRDGVPVEPGRVGPAQPAAVGCSGRSAAGAGIDDPDDEDLGDASRLRNVAVEGI